MPPSKLPTFTFSAIGQQWHFWLVQNYATWRQGHMCVNNPCLKLLHTNSQESKFQTFKCPNHYLLLYGMHLKFKQQFEHGNRVIQQSVGSWIPQYQMISMDHATDDKVLKAWVSYILRAHTHTHTRLTALFPGLPGWAGTRKVKPIWILLKQETVSGGGIIWAYASLHLAPDRITTPAPHHSVFYRPGALSAAQPTASKHWRHRYARSLV